MSKEAFLKAMDEILELEQGALTGSEKLEDLQGWTSMSMVSFIALADENFNKRVSPREIAAADTVDDLGKLLGL